MLLWLALLGALWLLLWEPRALPGVTSKKTLLLGHRGVRGSLPENTLEAFRAALDAGLDGLETDLQRCKGGEIVLYHDFTLPDGRGVRDLTLAELRETNPDIPTLQNLFELAHRYPGTLLNLEFKTVSWNTLGLEHAAAKAIRASGLGGRILVSSFNPLSLLRLKVYAPEVRIALLYSPDGPSWLRDNLAARLFARALHADALHPHHSLIHTDLATWSARRGVMLSAWTVNEAKDVKRLTQLSVNGLMADDPEALKNAFMEATWSPTRP